MKDIIIRNASIHNLKNITARIPKNKLTVVTGVSGSGKSSLVFDILYKEGFKGYLSLIGVMEQFSDSNRSYDEIKGICPVIALEQKTKNYNNPRSIVGTQSKMYDYLKMLFGAEGKQICCQCGSVLSKDGSCSSCNFLNKKIPTGKISKLLSFNSKEGMCLDCYGRGYIKRLDTNKIIANSQLTLHEICKPEWVYEEIYPALDCFLQNHKLAYDIRYEALDEDLKEKFLHGYRISEKNGFEGILNFLQHKMDFGKPGQRMFAAHKTETIVCSSCNGYRLDDAGLSIRLDGKHIGELGSMDISDLKEFLLEYRKQNRVSPAGNRLIEYLLQYADNFEELGMGYLSMFRQVPTLSGGELQRLMLISQMFSRLDSILYIFDEPTAGLHENEKKSLIDRLIRLSRSGNTVVVVEHDKSVVEAADYILDFGPYAGVDGGEIVYEGDYKGLLDCNSSISGNYFSEQGYYPIKEKKAICQRTESCIHLHQVYVNNLKDVEVSIPLKLIVGVAGVSGSGKSSLISKALLHALERHFEQENRLKGVADSEAAEENTEENILVQADGLKQIVGFSRILQEPIKRNRKSIPLTYLGIFDAVTQIYAKQEDAIVKGYKKGHFSMNSHGACGFCSGSGAIHENLHNFEYQYICPECKGRRYRDDVLEITYLNKSISEVLQMSITEGVTFFSGQEKITSILSIAERIGLGYLTLGQPLTTLSGGEAQRLKLAKELSVKHGAGWLYIFDEPTIGLSNYDVSKLLEIINELAEQGSSVIIIEHDLTVLRYCDWIIELGEGGGRNGGNIISQGTVDTLKSDIKSNIGRLL